MTRYISYLILTVMLIMVSCGKEANDAPLIKGNIKGNINATDAYGYRLDDLSGIKIRISSPDYAADTITDSNGNFIFEDAPFGRYYLICTKEGFIQRHVVPSGYIDGEVAFGHIGGEVATTVNEELLGIPDFGYLVDSVERHNCYVNCHLQLYEASKTCAGISYLMLMYFDDTPDVDADNYDRYHIDVGYLPPGNAWKMTLNVCYTDVLSSFTSDTIYCRIYPIPFCYLPTDDAYLTIPKGKPSNVFAIPNNL